MKVYVGSVGYSSLEVRHLMSIMGLQELGVSVHIQAKHALWEHARSMIASRFFRETDADVLLLVEADVAFEPADALLLCEQAVQYGLVGAASGETPRDACWVDEAPRAGQAADAPIPVRWLGTGMLAIHRGVFEAIVQRPDMPVVDITDGGIWPFFYPAFVEMDNRRMTAGDVQGFCERARAEGFVPHVNVSLSARRVAESEASPVDVYAKAATERLAGSPDQRTKAAAGSVAMGVSGPSGPHRKEANHAGDRAKQRA